ncbi:MAG: lipopolysaccharide biosynthesis protein, partial [Gemmatimonadales bacterium]
MRSLAWTGTGRWLSQLLSWASTLIVARLLTPEDYGLVGMSSVFFFAIQSLGEFGLGAAIIKHRELTREQIAQLNSVCLLFGLASAAVICASAGPMSVFFSSPELYPVMLATSTTFVISSFRTVPSGLLQRDLQFKRLAAIDIAQGLVLAVSVPTFAFLGFRYWSLVIGGVLSTLAGTVALLLARPHGFAPPRSETIRGATTFGGQVVVSRFGWYALFNADFLVAGRTLGKAALGNYGFAWTLASLPVEKISLLVTRVSLPFFSAVQQNKEALKRYVLVMTEGLALVTFPAAVGIGLLADEIVPVALGKGWVAAIAPLRILAIVAPMRSVAALLPQLSTVVGRTAFAMYHSIGCAAVMALAFFVGSHWGTVGIAAAWALVYPLVLLPLLGVLLHDLRCSVLEYFGAMQAALTGCLSLALVVIAMRSILPGSIPALARTGIEIGAGALTSAGTLWGLH